MPPPRGSVNPIEGPGKSFSSEAASFTHEQPSTGDYEVTTVLHNDSYPEISPLSIAPLNKAVFVVGASRGIGLAIAKSFAQAGASHIALGARSELTSVKEEVLKAAADAKRSAPQVLCVELDVASQKSTEAASALVEKEFGKLDILLINAGKFSMGPLIADTDPEEWWDIYNVNLKGPYLISRACLPLMLKGGDKTIVTTASVGAFLITPGLSAYQDSKLAVLRLMEFVNREYADEGVTAFAIHPGNVPTELIGGPEGIPEDLKHIFVETPELSADTIVYLTKEKRVWLGGRYINVTWDMPELMAKEDEVVKGDKLKVKFVF
ncbi:Short chain dehydrogenase mpl6 [Hyphodiscus hymeniophilus]|uniref:Short chain dehydrogenase mpl6 n=1 Tax=Hyphodiscus hymeniophilus TaxID=353542 RepID=A0A9P6VET8_9HELO|nr:Short chain dehydrogenase mpl6 [Hyphodiscus hymeniophilus]